MEIYVLQTGTVRVKQFQLTGATSNLSRFYQLLFTQKWSEWIPIYSWLIKSANSLILVDTGETSKIYEEGYLPKGGLYHKAVQTKIKQKEEIPYQLKALGYTTKDIDTIILTHLHGDHIGGIEHFPDAHILAPKTEYVLALSKKGPGSGFFAKNWPDWFKPELVNYTDKKEGNFPQCHYLNEQVMIVPTPGHSTGHQSVIVKDGTVTYFIGGDLTYNLETLKAEIPNVVLSNKDAIESVKRVHEYVKSTSCIYLSSHDWHVPKILKEKLTYDNF